MSECRRMPVNKYRSDSIKTYNVINLNEIIDLGNDYELVLRQLGGLDFWIVHNAS